MPGCVHTLYLQKLRSCDGHKQQGTLLCLLSNLTQACKHSKALCYFMDLVLIRPLKHKQLMCEAKYAGL